jgi:hypothetical protein
VAAHGATAVASGARSTVRSKGEQHREMEWRGKGAHCLVAEVVQGGKDDMHMGGATKTGGGGGSLSLAATAVGSGAVCFGAWCTRTVGIGPHWAVAWYCSQWAGPSRFLFQITSKAPTLKKYKTLSFRCPEISKFCK